MLKRILGMIASVALAAASLPAGLLPPLQTAQAAPTPPPGSWPFWRYDMQRTNRVAVGSGNITQPAIKWSYPVGGAPSATVRDITGPNGLPDGVPEIIAWGGGRVRAFNSQTGDPIWTSDLILGLREPAFIGDLDANGSVEVVAHSVNGANPNAHAVVLAGASGATLSRVSYYVFEPYAPLVADATDDGKMELFVTGVSTTQRSVYSFQAGASAPQLLVTNTVPLYGSYAYARMPVVADLNGDSSTEVLHAIDLYGYAVMPSTSWTVVSTQTIPDTSFPNVWVTETVSSLNGPEIVSVWVRQTNFKLMLHKVGPAPAYSITAEWTRTVATPIFEFDAGPIMVANLDGSGNPEIVWSYRVNDGLGWRTEVVNASSGTPLATVTDRRLCYVYTAVNLDADGASELLLCSPDGGIHAYDWTGSTLTPKWSQPGVALQGIELESDLPYVQQRMPRVAADFNNDGAQDVVGAQGGAVRVFSGLTGAPVYTYTPPVGVRVAVRHVGDLDGNPATPEVLVATSDGYLRYLDSTLNEKRSVYAGAGFADPYVVDTNGDGRNEVIFVDGSGRLLNLDPFTATQQLPPARNWAWSVRLPWWWHPMNLDNAGLWEYLTVDDSQAPTYTLKLMTKDLAGNETVQATYTFTDAPDFPVLHAVGQFAGGGPHDLIVSLGTYPYRPAYGLSWNGALSSPFTKLWEVANAANGTLPAAVGNDLTGDGNEEIAWMREGSFSRIVNGNTGGVIAGTGMNWQAQPVLANLDADPAVEALYAASSNGTFRVAEFTTAFPIAFDRVISGADRMSGAVAIAQVDADNNLEIVYGTLDGVLGAMNGANGSDIYTSTLGVGFNVGTCTSDINTPVSYPGVQGQYAESLCPGAARFAAINSAAVADIDGDAKDEILAASQNGYLYALNAEDGSLRWAYNFYYPVTNVRAANLDGDSTLEVLVSAGDGFLYALDQQSFAPSQSAWDGPSPAINDDIDVQVSQLCYSGYWRATSDLLLGQPDGYRIALRDATGALMTDGYLDVPHTPGASVVGAQLCFNDANPQRRLVNRLIPGQRYFLEIISYKGANASTPRFTDGVEVLATASLEDSRKSVSPEVTVPGGVLTWTIVVRNTGQAAAPTQVIDPIPLNTSYVAGSATATMGSASYDSANNRIVWSSGAALAVGQAVTITFQTQVASAFAGGLIRNEAEVNNLDNGLRTRVSATASVGASNLSSAQKTVSAATAALNDVLTYTIRVTNTGVLTASGTLVNDPLPAEVVYQAGSLSSSGGSGAASYNAIQKAVRWTGSLGPGQTVEVRFAVKVNVANGIVDNCARIVDVQNGSFERCARTVVGAGGSSLVGSSKTSDRLNYATTDQITYTITLVNNGTQAAPQLVMRDALPGGLTLIAATASAGVLSYPAPNVVRWDGGLAPGQGIQIVIKANLNAPDGVLKNTAVVTDVSASRTYTLVREVLVGTAPSINSEKFAEPPSVDVGDEIKYVIRLENTGNTVATSAVLTDPLPAGTSYVVGSAEANYGTASYNSAAQQLEWSGPVYLTGTTVITWRVKLEAGAQPGELVVNVADSYDNVSDYDQAVAVTSIAIPPGKALIRSYVYSGTGTTAMPGVQVSAAGLVTVSGTTDAAGKVSLLVDAAPTPTNYAVFQVVPAGYVNLTPNPVGVPGVVEGGVYDVVFRNAAGAPPGYGWVRGVVFNDANGDGTRNIHSEVGLANVTVSASDGQTMQTLGDGSYFFLLAAGSRVLTQTNLAGWVSTTPDVAPVTVASQATHEVNFGDWLCPPGSPICNTPPAGYAWLFGYVYLDADGALNLPDGVKDAADAGLASVDVGATVGTFSSNDQTDASGFYYMQIPAGSGVVTYTLPSGYLALTPASVPVNANDGLRLRVDFGVISSTLCGSGQGIVNGFVYSDTLQDGQFITGVDGPTLTEATVSYGSASQTTNWMYALVCVPAGAGTATSTNPAGYTNTTPNSVAVTVPDGGAVSADFGKAFQTAPLGLRHVYAPIAIRQP